MALTENELIISALRESKDFSKSIRGYLYDIGKQRQLTEKEKGFYDLAHEVHIRTNDALLISDKH